jgi:hypothetical protein
MQKIGQQVCQNRQLLYYVGFGNIPHPTGTKVPDWIRILNTSEREAYRKTHIINALPTKSRCGHFYNQNYLSKNLPEVNNLVQEFVDENKVVLHILLRNLAKVVLHHLHKL